MADTNDTQPTDGELTEKEQLKRTQEFLEERGVEDSAVHESLAELEGDREQVQALADLKVRVAEAERAGLDDDAAIDRLREQIDELEVETGVRQPDPTPDEQAAERREALQKRLSIAETTGDGLPAARAAALLEPYDAETLNDAAALEEAVQGLNTELSTWSGTDKIPGYEQKLRDRLDLLERAADTPRRFDSVEDFAEYAASRADDGEEWGSITSEDL